MLINVVKALAKIEKHLEKLMSKMLREEFPELVPLIDEITVRHGFDIFVSLPYDTPIEQERELYRFFREWIRREDTDGLLFETHVDLPGMNRGGVNPQHDALLEESLEKHKDVWERLAQL